MPLVDPFLIARPDCLQKPEDPFWSPPDLSRALLRLCGLRLTARWRARERKSF